MMNRIGSLYRILKVIPPFTFKKDEELNIVIYSYWTYR